MRLTCTHLGVTADDRVSSEPNGVKRITIHVSWLISLGLNFLPRLFQTLKLLFKQL